MPDFQQFAERCQLVKRVSQAITDYYRAQPEPSDEGLMFVAGTVPFNEGALFHESVTTTELSDFAIEAERHARLLQQIWEWANSGPDFPGYYSPVELAATGRAKAHVRSLLVGKQEAK